MSAPFRSPSALRTFARTPARALSRLIYARLAAILCVLALIGPAGAASLDRDALVRFFPDPLRVGARDPEFPVWPITKQNGTEEELVAYVFESVELSPIPGFSGTPPNLLVALTPAGQFMEVRVLSQHEPVFLDGLGPEPLFQFVKQYAGLNLRQSIKVGSNLNRGSQQSSANVFIDGVAKATASVRIVNESVITAALKVARAKLGYAAGKDPALISRPRMDAFEALDWNELLERGYVRRLRLSNRQIDQAFRGTVGEDIDRIAREFPDEVFSELYVAYVNSPVIGRNLLGPNGYEALRRRLEEGQSGLWVMSFGRYGFIDEHFVRGSVPDRLSMRQGELPIEIRDTDLEPPLAAAGAPRAGPAKIFKISAHAGFDPADPWQMALRVTREKGQIWPERVSRDFPLELRLPEALFDRPPPEEPAWMAAWRARALDIGIIAAGLAALTVALIRPRWITASAARLRWARWGYLAFTLAFIGWHAQAQLSIVTILGLIRGGNLGDLSFLLHDPPSLILWIFVLATLLLWGRGTFCGWLCPFGALQEFAAAAGRAAGLRPRRIPEKLDRRLENVKYVVLAGLLGTAALAPAIADQAVEIEPFKTAITLVFDRSWPFVLYALALLLAAAVVYKLFCRYLCPLGAALAFGGWLRRLNWIPRRDACGQPCQLCRHRCEYQAIERSGAIRYQECFQCMDCVAIYHDARRCAPLLLEARKGRRVVPIAARPREAGGKAASKAHARLPLTTPEG